jgi:hypothetical protein
MGRLKTIAEDLIRIDVIPHKDKNKPPHLTAYVNIYGTDHKGELTAMGNLSGCKTKNEVLLELGKMVLESSRNIKSWIESKALPD